MVNQDKINEMMKQRIQQYMADTKGAEELRNRLANGDIDASTFILSLLLDGMDIGVELVTELYKSLNNEPEKWLS